MCLKSTKGEETMTNDIFKQGLAELYQGEILGEVLFDQMLSYFQDQDKQYKLSVMLQLETETKARLRPAMVLLGIDLREQKEFRKNGLDMASSMKGKSWESAMTIIRDAVKPAVERYKEIVSCAPPEYLKLAESMVIHEQSLYDFAELELAGEGKKSISVINSRLKNKISLR
jgi:hypothetical protein